MRRHCVDVKMGEKVPVAIDALGGEQSAIDGKVVQIVPAADPAGRSFIVKVELPADARSPLGPVRAGVFSTRRARRCSFREQPSWSAVNSRVFTCSGRPDSELRYVTLGKTAGDTGRGALRATSRENACRRPGDRELRGQTDQQYSKERQRPTSDPSCDWRARLRILSSSPS